MSPFEFESALEKEVPSADRLLLRQLHFFGHHGVSAEERRAGGVFIVDLEVETETERSARSDDVGDTVNYVDLHEVARRVVEDGEFHLLEALAARLAEELLNLPLVARVHLRVTKPPRLAGQGIGFAVEIVRPV
ncbi:MAG: dihydroneopterin aldolase [Candidatus Dormiibacterota bacterium]